MSDENPKYDFNFITLALGLVPTTKGRAAINPGAIVYLTRDEDGRAVVTMHGGQVLMLNAQDMADLEETIKRRSEEGKILQREAIRNQFLAQQEVMQEMNTRVQTPIIGGAVPKNRRH